MRCKCGYITFDHLEICPKCNKDISKISEALSGVTFKTEVPDFLRLEMDSYDDEEGASDIIDLRKGVEDEDEEVDFFAGDEEAEEAEEETEIEFDLADDDDSGDSDEADDGLDLAVDDNDGGLDLDLSLDSVGDDDSDDGGLDLSLDSDEEDSGLDLSLDDDSDDNGLDLSLDSDEAGDLDLSLDGDTGSDLGDLDLSLDMESDTTAGSGDSLNLDGLDLPDLSPGSDDGGLGEPIPEKKDGLGALDDGLSGLEMDDFDLNAPLEQPSSSGSGSSNGSSGGAKDPGPGAKTGTALDDFDIDLGDLG